jgi:hypothetical protein
MLIDEENSNKDDIEATMEHPCFPLSSSLSCKIYCLQYIPSPVKTYGISQHSNWFAMNK